MIHHDIPLHLRFLDARRHDSVSGLVSLAEFHSLNPELKIANLCLDSAHDNYPTYNLCNDWNIRPFIDLNTNRGRPPSIPDHVTIDTDGTPLCHAGYRMAYWGTVLDAAGAVRWPAARWTVAPAKIPVHLHPMAVAFIINLNGISDSILLLHAAQLNIRKSIITEQLQNV